MYEEDEMKGYRMPGRPSHVCSLCRSLVRKLSDLRIVLSRNTVRRYDNVDLQDHISAMPGSDVDELRCF